MKKYVPVLLASGVLLLSFQNCSNQKLESEAGLNSPTQTKIDDPILAQAQSLDILTQNDQQKISLNLRTGDLIQQTSSGSVRKCLSESMRGQIYDLLQNSNLCESPVPASDALCAQIYAAPYGEIHWANKSIRVGEAYSSCQKDVDLCGQDGMILRGLLRDIISRWSEWSCDFKVVAK